MTINDPRAFGLVGTPNWADENESGERTEREIVGADDATADYVRSGGDADLPRAHRDSDGVPTGRADADADAARAAGEPVDD
jgi:hypothetical protein